MDKEQLKGLFLKRIFIEYELFKDSMLRKEKTAIFEESYRIEIYKNLYKILIHEASGMAETVLRRLVYQINSVMDFFYQEWLKKEDSSYSELREYVSSELGNYYMELEREMRVERNIEAEREIKAERNAEPECEMKAGRKTETETEIEAETAVGKEGAYGKKHSKAA